MLIEPSSTSELVLQKNCILRNRTHQLSRIAKVPSFLPKAAIQELLFFILTPVKLIFVPGSSTQFCHCALNTIECWLLEWKKPLNYALISILETSIANDKFYVILMTYYTSTIWKVSVRSYCLFTCNMEAQLDHATKLHTRGVWFFIGMVPHRHRC